MGDSSVSTSGTKKKRKGVLRSLGKGLSIRKKKNRPDDDSVVGISLDAPSGSATASTTPMAGMSAPAAARSMPGGGRNVSFSDDAPSGSSAPAAKPIRVVLLLMDPGSRRFELLQLEFDSSKAMVSDVLRQIQSSATEKSLRDLSFAGVCDHAGMEMISTMKLSKFCKGDDVVMAIPTNMTGKDTAKLAGPILGDPKVEEMLAPCGVNIPKSIKRSRSEPAPGSQLTKIAEEDSRRKGTRSLSSPQKSASNSSGGGGKPKKGKSPSSILPTAILGIVVSFLLFVAARRHVRVTTPLASGSVLLPGQWKSQCGVFDLFPPQWLTRLPMEKIAPGCDASSSSMLELGSDGTLRYFKKGDADDERREVWSVKGSDEGQCQEGEEEQCFKEGATFVKDGYSWYVDMDGSRTELNDDVIRDFATKN